MDIGILSWMFADAPMLNLLASYCCTDKRLLHAARTDDLELLQEIISSGAFDANHSDGVGRNALHYAAASQSTQVLPEILNLEIDVDYQDRTNADTPLHAAVNVDIPDGDAGTEVEEIRNWIGKSPRLYLG